MSKKEFENDVSNNLSGNCMFPITVANETMLTALSRYAMMLDYVTCAREDERLNVEALINSILSEGMTKRIKELVKKHSFDDTQEFIDTMLACQDGEEVANEVRSHEKLFYQTTHDEILSHIPLEDRQQKIPF